MTRLVDYLIEDVRSHTENEDFSDTIGIKDIEFLRFLNDAQYRIHSLIVQQHPSVFLEEKTQSVTKDLESYSLPREAYLRNKVSNIEYSPTGLNKDFYPLKRASLKQRYAGAEGDPSIYIRKSGLILLNPVPNSNSGSLRFTYVKGLPRLDKRRGSVASVTLDSSNNTISALSLNVSTDVVDSTALDKVSRVTIVDDEGTIKMSNIKVSSINASTGVVTVDPSFVYESGQTIEVGDYILAGAYSTTHYQVDEMVERYLIAYCAYKIFHRDSNSDIDAQRAELFSMENEIVAAYADISDDIEQIPEIIDDEDIWIW